ncbi:MAG: N-acetylglucosamine-6-phosphate deacetylase, partial [Miltoncostaeaceae bacterium]|nr:N-acetylglucosamine-6-phosphate deacetylase [Miltoncostaeaceae bacterium]
MSGTRLGGLSGLVLRGERLVPGSVRVRDGAFDTAGRGAASLRALPEGWALLPGMVDVQVNGFAGAEVGEDPDQLAAVAGALPAAGVSAFCPTLVSRSRAGYARAEAAFRAVRWPVAGARPLGVHLEGPFLARTRAGAHHEGRLRDPDPTAVDDLAARFRPRIVTLAPELPGALDAIRRLARRGVSVACGHTEAGHEQGRAAIGAGARLLTHALNAMRGIESRQPSALVAFLGDRRTHVSLIGDGAHVAPAVAALVARLAGPRLVLVSDATAACGAPPGRYPLGERVVRWDGVRALAGEGDGVLAGGVAPLWRGVRTLVEAGIPVGAALTAAC